MLLIADTADGAVVRMSDRTIDCPVSTMVSGVAWAEMEATAALTAMLRASAPADRTTKRDVVIGPFGASGVATP